MGSGGMRLLLVVDEVFWGVRIFEEVVVLVELIGWVLRVGVIVEEVVEDWGRLNWVLRVRGGGVWWVWEKVLLFGKDGEVVNNDWGIVLLILVIVILKLLLFLLLLEGMWD